MRAVRTGCSGPTATGRSASSSATSARSPMGSPASTPSRAMVREEEELRHMRASIEGQAIAIEAGAATDDPNDVVTHAIAGAIADELTAAAATPAVVGSEGSQMSSERA